MIVSSMCALCFFFSWYGDHRYLHVLTHSFPTRRSSDLADDHEQLLVGARRGAGFEPIAGAVDHRCAAGGASQGGRAAADAARSAPRSEEHTSELQSLMRISYAVFCLKKKNTKTIHTTCAYTPGLLRCSNVNKQHDIERAMMS